MPESDPDGALLREVADLLEGDEEDGPDEPDEPVSDSLLGPEEVGLRVQDGQIIVDCSEPHYHP